MLKSRTRTICAFILLSFFACMHGIGTAHAGQDARVEEQTARKAYADRIRKSYNFEFGKDEISAPGNATVEGNDFLQPSAFPDARYCGHCHKEAYHEWRQALHSNSFRTPFYRRSVNVLLRTKGIEYARHCDSCHNPVAVFAGALDSHFTGDRSFDGDGVTCMVCHSIKRVDSKLGNGGFELAVPAVIVDAEGRRVPGVVPDAEILAHLDRHAKAVMQPIYRSAEFCAACHKANLPPMLNDYKWIRAFTTYDEWQTSKFSHQNPLTFYQADAKTCQSCHMPRERATLPEPGAKSGRFASHRWLAGNTAVPFYYGYDEQLKKTIEFLRSGDYLNVDIFGLKIGDDPKLIAPLGSTPFALTGGKQVEAWVVIQNKNIGHSLIPEVRDLYEAWVQFTVKDAKGTVLYSSGDVGPDGMLDPSAHSFTNRPVDVVGNFVDNHMVWAIHSVAYDNTIQSGRSALVRYRFELPRTVKGSISVTARVNYRHMRQSYLNNIFGPDHPAYPLVELASRTRVLKIGENAPGAAEPGDNPDWMRWNNVGIGLLDELQHQDALDAFEHVIRLNPGYANGYINIGLDYLDWEKYDNARMPLEMALRLHPDDARALYYLALVERRARNSAAEVADLEKVVAQYPDCRDARRELGISYYQQDRGDEAIAQFKALQAIDPDDLAAHYNLAILYRRKGLKKQAAFEAEQYKIKAIDPGAPTYSLDYLRKHPEISIESVPWHVHTETKAQMQRAAAQP